MILFPQDFQTQRATVHYQTDNKSFLRMYNLLEHKKITNNKFFLALYDKEIAKYDPHNLKDPSLELRSRIVTEVEQNPWYYYRECVRVPVAGDNPGPFLLNRANLAQIWLFHNSIDTFLTIPRQNGKTIGALCISSWLLFFGAMHFNMGMFAKDDDLRTENVKRVKFIRDALPEFLISIDKRDVNNTEKVTYVKLSNNYDTYVAQSDPKQASLRSRGATSVANQVDEAAFFRNIDVTLPTLVGSTGTAADQAKLKNLPTGMMLTSTAGNRDDKPGGFCYNLIKSAMHFNEKLYDSKDQKDLERIVKANSSNRYCYIVYSYLQLGKSNEWKDNLVAKMGNPEKNIILRDLFNIWTSGSSEGALNPRLIDMIKDKKQEPTFVETTDEGYLINWYITEKERARLKDRFLAIGVDGSTVIGQDFTTVTILDFKDMSVIATMRVNETTIPRFAKFLAHFIIAQPKSVLIPEANHVGISIIDIVAELLMSEGLDPTARIFNRIVQEKKSDKQVNQDLRSRDKVRPKMGFYTNHQTRNQLYKEILPHTIELNNERIYDRTIIQEMLELEVRNGRIDHGVNKHDDQLISYLLACWLILKGKHLSHYGVYDSDILCDVSSSGKKVDKEYKQLNQRLYTKMNKMQTFCDGISSDQLKFQYQMAVDEIRDSIDFDVIGGAGATTEQIVHKEQLKNNTRNTFDSKQFVDIWGKNKGSVW